MSDNTRRILGISSVQYGTRNDQHIVKLDETVTNLRKGWCKDVIWGYYDLQGFMNYTRGVYFICDGGYLRWPSLICPFKHESCSTQKGYFSSRLESVRKDVECTFGILKKRWRCLDYRFCFRDIKVCEKVFTVCAILHNMMVEDRETVESTIHVGRGAPVPGDSMWIRNVVNPPPLSRAILTDTVAAVEWMKRRNDLAVHVEFMSRANKRSRCV